MEYDLLYQNCCFYELQEILCTIYYERDINMICIIGTLAFYAYTWDMLKCSDFSSGIINLLVDESTRYFKEAPYILFSLWTCLFQSTFTRHCYFILIPYFVFAGVVGTTRFCSSRDMGNQCQYIRYPDHDRVYRACIYTCTRNNCNGARGIATATLLPVVIATVLAAYIKWSWSHTCILYDIYKQNFVNMCCT